MRRQTRGGRRWWASLVFRVGIIRIGVVIRIRCAEIDSVGNRHSVDHGGASVFHVVTVMMSVAVAGYVRGKSDAVVGSEATRAKRGDARGSTIDGASTESGRGHGGGSTVDLSIAGRDKKQRQREQTEKCERGRNRMSPSQRRRPSCGPGSGCEAEIRSSFEPK